MPRYVIDSYAWIEYLVGSIKGMKVKEIVESENNEIITPTIVLAEVTSITQREERNAEEAYKMILGLTKTQNLQSEDAKEIGLLHAEMRKKIKDFGMADTVVLHTARRLVAKVVTGDPHFKGFKEVIML